MKTLLFLFVSTLLGIYFFSESLKNTESNSKKLLEKPEHLIDGKSFTCKIEPGVMLLIEFKNGKLTYQRDPNKPRKTFSYQSRKLDEGVYYVHWHEVTLKNFITVVINFNHNTYISSSIMNYGSKQPIITFEGKFIKHVNDE